ncbi:MAG: hypothetical protein ABSH53_14965 [Holophaga sp.]|jgi:hypothetical protein
MKFLGNLGETDNGERNKNDYFMMQVLSSDQAKWSENRIVHTASIPAP